MGAGISNSPLRWHQISQFNVGSVKRITHTHTHKYYLQRTIICDLTSAVKVSHTGPLHLWAHSPSHLPVSAQKAGRGPCRHGGIFTADDGRHRLHLALTALRVPEASLCDKSPVEV